MKKICLMVVFILVVVTVFCNANASEEVELMRTIMKREAVEDVFYGNVETLADVMTVSIPADWEKLKINEVMGEKVAFHYKGTDSEGNDLYFSGIVMDIPIDMRETYKGVVHEMEEAGYDYTIESLNGIEAILTGDEDVVLYILFTEGGKAIGLEFGGLETDVYYKTTYPYHPPLSEKLKSDKLSRDIAAIVRSVKKTGDVGMLKLTAIPVGE